MRLMDEKRYEGLVFGETSAMTQFNRAGRPLRTILEREDLHERLVNGSDYPLPAVNMLIRMSPLVRRGYIAADEAESLKEIYQYNPLLFDFTLKRHLKHPETGRRLPASVFMQDPAQKNKSGRGLCDCGKKNRKNIYTAETRRTAEMRKGN